MLDVPVRVTAAPKTTTSRPGWAFEVALIAAFYAGYAWIRDEHGRDSAAYDDRRIAFAHARAVRHLEGRIHLDPERAVQSLLPHAGAFVRGLNAFYLLAHVTVTVAVLVFLLLRRPGIYRRCRNALLASSVVALGVFALYPTAPPRLLPGAHIRDTLAVGGWWSLNHGGIERIADPYAAMPSLHLAWSSWVALSLAAAFTGRARRALFALYPLAVTFVVLATGAHWLLDTLAGVTLALVSWRLTARIPPVATWAARHRAGEPSGWAPASSWWPAGRGVQAAAGPPVDPSPGAGASAGRGFPP